MTTSRAAVPVVGAIGLVAAVVAGFAGGRAYTGSSVPPTRWWGLLPSRGYVAGDGPVWGVLLWVGITAMSAAWLLAIRLARQGRLTERQGWLLAGTWGLPLAIAPPLVSKDVYAYAAQSTLLHHGVDIYRQGPNALGSVPGRDAARALAGVDPRWHDSASPYGPATTLVQRLAGGLGGGDPTVALIVLRIVAVVAVFAIVRLGLALAGDRRVDALVLLALNPLLLVHALSAAHVEALMGALILAALVAARREVWWLAVVMACLAGEVKAPGFLAVAAVLLWHVLGTDDARERLRRGATDVAVAVVTAGVLGVLVTDGWGWLRNLSTPTAGDPTSSITGNVAALVSSDGSTLETALFTVGAVTAGVILVVLTLTFRRRDPAVSLGRALLAVAFLAPVTYPWYALWGVVCLLPTARGRTRIVLVGLCVLEAGASIPGASAGVTKPLTHVTALVVVAATVVLVLRAQRPNSGRRRAANAATPSRPSGESAQRAIDAASKSR